MVTQANPFAAGGLEVRCLASGAWWAVRAETRDLRTRRDLRDVGQRVSS